jgi:hypothetical protein
MENINSKMTEKKKTYVTPELTVHGDIEVITQATSLGTTFDGQFNHTRIGS